MDERRRIHFEVLDKFQAMKDFTTYLHNDTFIKQPPDEYVSVEHHLLSNSRGVYVPKDYDFAYSIKVSIDSNNYKNKIEYKNDNKLITYYLPDGDLDGQKDRDIYSLKNNFDNNIPVGVVLKEANEYNVLGLGRIIQFSKNYIVIECTNEKLTYKNLDYTEELFELERSYEIKTRLKQGIFRLKLLDLYSSCNICDCNIPEILVASHIKPWSKSTNTEKLDSNNGLLLCPTHDTLFDKGYISFDSDGKITISSLIDDTNKELLNINYDQKIDVNSRISHFLKYHVKHVFKP